jgi:Uma2 family endonuclease
MAVATLRYVSEEEYLESEAISLVKHEYLAGQIYAMAGSSPEHALITNNVGAELRALAAAKGCSVYSSDLRIRVQATGLNTYPDVSVVCGQIEKTDQRPPAATNPVLLVEVLSESTEEYDRGEKWRHYQQIDALTDYLLVCTDWPRVEHYCRQSRDSWTYRQIEGLEAKLEIELFGGELSLFDVYRGIDFSEVTSRRRGLES